MATKRIIALSVAACLTLGGSYLAVTHSRGGSAGDVLDSHNKEQSTKEGERKKIVKKSKALVSSRRAHSTVQSASSSGAGAPVQLAVSPRP